MQGAGVWNSNRNTATGGVQDSDCLWTSQSPHLSNGKGAKVKLFEYCLLDTLVFEPNLGSWTAQFEDEFLAQVRVLDTANS